MEALLLFVVGLSAVCWAGFALLPWGAWRNREVLEATPVKSHDAVVPGGSLDFDAGALGEITVVIPARNEAAHIQETIFSIAAQGTNLKITLVDDGSEDGTAGKVCQ